MNVKEIVSARQTITLLYGCDLLIPAANDCERMIHSSGTISPNTTGNGELSQPVYSGEYIKVWERSTNPKYVRLDYNCLHEVCYIKNLFKISYICAIVL